VLPGKDKPWAMLRRQDQTQSCHLTWTDLPEVNKQSNGGNGILKVSNKKHGAGVNYW